MTIPEEEFSKFKLTKGDIIIARTGATVGKAYLYNNDKEMVFASYLIRFRTNPNIILPEYLYIFMQSSLYWNHIFKEQSGTGQPNVNAKKLGNLEVIYPKEISKQKQIIENAKNFKTHLKILYEEQENISFQLKQLPKSVLSKAFKGELIS